MVALAIVMIVPELVEVCFLQIDMVHNHVQTRQFLFPSQATKHEISLRSLYKVLQGALYVIPLKCVIEIDWDNDTYARHKRTPFLSNDFKRFLKIPFLSFSWLGWPMRYCIV